MTSGARGSAISLDASAFLAVAGDKAAGDVISNTQIVNNVIRTDSRSPSGIFMEGGNTTSSPPSRISAVTIQNVRQ